MYFFAVQNGKGVPDTDLLALMSNRICFTQVMCPPEEWEAGNKLASALNISCTPCTQLSPKQSDETDRAFYVRLSNEWRRLSEIKENTVILLPPDVMYIMTDMPYKPNIGYSEVI